MEFLTGDSFVVLKEGTDINQFNAKIADLVTEKQREGLPSTLEAISFSSLYLQGQFENGVQSAGRIEYVRLFSIIAGFILLIACVNFMNLSTAMAAKRLKEVGIKKTVGVSRMELALQFLGESILLTFTSLIIAILAVWLILPNFNVLTGKDLLLSFDTELIGVILCITTLTGLVAGSYPAFYLSGFNPIRVLKGKLDSFASEFWIRKGLVIFQFSISIILMVAVLVVSKQVDYINNKNLGYNRDNVIHFDIEGKVNENLETFILECSKIPGITKVSSIAQTVAGGSLNKWIIDQWEGQPSNHVSFEARWVNYDLFETLEIDMAEGRTFSKDFGSEDSKIIFNQAAIDFMNPSFPCFLY